MRTLAVISCSFEKGASPAPARELYRGPYFQAMMCYANTHSSAWCILSAKHGLINPTKVIEPYNTAFPNPDSVSVCRTVHTILKYGLDQYDRFILLGGYHYRKHMVRALEATDYCGQVVQPTAGMRYRDQIAFLQNS